MATERLDRSLVLVMAVATGVAVASNYYAQPLLPVMRHDLHMSSTVAGLIVTVAQIGYAAGLLFLLPLGDLVERRTLVVTLSALSAVALVVLGLSPNGSVLLPAAFVVGALSVLAQVLVPFSASLAHEHERGQVVGLVMSGLLLGILLARTVAGALAQAGDWRVVYLVAAGLMAVQAVVLRLRLPEYREETRHNYVTLLRSVGQLLRDEPVLRLRSLYGFLSFGTFSVLWTSLAFLLHDRYHLSTLVIGLFGLVGAAGALAATMTGRLSDRGHQHASTGAGAAMLAVSWLLLWAGRHHMSTLVLGIVLLDVGVQGVHISNQGAIYRLRPDARSRLTAAYMFLYFVGGAVGSAVSAALYSRHGWSGVSLAGEVFGGGALLVWATSSFRRRSESSVPPSSSAR
jgi:predicted MFS family arabinose efflux permease